jgi:hypothetical protein
MSRKPPRVPRLPRVLWVCGFAAQGNITDMYAFEKPEHAAEEFAHMELDPVRYVRADAPRAKAKAKKGRRR